MGFMKHEVQQPKVMVLVLNWNEKNNTLECLRSLKEMDYLNFETVVIDNASSDGSADEIGGVFPGLKILRNNENLGYAGGNNAGIEYAVKNEADYILILNNDTVVEKNLLKNLLEAVSQYPKSIISPLIYSYEKKEKVEFYSASWNPRAAVFKLTKEMPEKSYEKLVIETAYAPGCAILFPAKLVSEIGHFDERFFLVWEEADLCYRAKSAGYKVLMCLKAKVWHKGSASFEGGIRGRIYQYYYFRNKMLWIEKNLRGKARILAFAVCLKEVLLAMGSCFDSRKKDLGFAKIKGFFHYLSRFFGQLRDTGKVISR